MRNKYVSQAFKLKKTEINFEKLLDWTCRFQTQAPNDYNAYYDELAGEFNPETKKYFKWMIRTSLTDY